MEKETEEATRRIEEIASSPLGEFLEEGEDKGDKVALEECLHAIATLALEQKAGKRQGITCEEIQAAFAACDVSEIFDEAALFFGEKDDAQGEDLGSYGAEEDDEEDLGEEDSLEGDEEGED